MLGLAYTFLNTFEDHFMLQQAPIQSQLLLLTTPTLLLVTFRKRDVLLLGNS